MYKINITDTASSDLRQSALYIAINLNNKIAAENLLDAADKEISSLADFPYRNKLVEDDFLASIGIRIQIVQNYFVFYVIREETKTISILRFLHSRRDWMSILKSENK